METMKIIPHFHAHEKGGRSCKRPKKERTERYSDNRLKRSNRSLLVRDMGCEGHEKRWVVVGGSPD